MSIMPNISIGVTPAPGQLLVLDIVGVAVGVAAYWCQYLVAAMSL
jgi:hypothetical protein